MKLFIWDDYNWKLIEPTEEYNKNEYFIVRKLFVQWPKEPNDEKAYNDVIRQHFEVYGSIESVETVNGTSSSAGAPNADVAHIHEAYVTFSQSENAFNAFMANRSNSISNAIKVLPADTWHQPGIKMGSSDGVRVFSTISHHNTNANRPKYFNQPQISHFEEESPFSRHFSCEHASFDVEIEFNKFKLKRVREIIGPLATRVGHLILKIDMNSDTSNMDCLSSDEFFKRFARILNAKLGENLVKLTLIAPHMNISKEILGDFAPLLLGLKSLILYVDFVVIYQLRDYCPRLINLEVNAKSLDGDLFEVTIDNWPSIESLAICGQLSIESGSECGIKFRRFIELNPQLEMIQIRCVVDNVLLQTIADHLPNLVLFEIVRNTYEDIDLVLDLLAGLKKLSTLNMNILKVKNDELWEMEKCARQFKQMKRLRLVTLCQSFVDNADEFQHSLQNPMAINYGCLCRKPQLICKFPDGHSFFQTAIQNDRKMLAIFINVQQPRGKQDKQMLKAVLDATLTHYPDQISCSSSFGRSGGQYFTVNYAQVTDIAKGSNR